jgi:hypothetical protein
MSRRSFVVRSVVVAVLSVACRPSAPREAREARVAASAFEPRTIEIVDYWTGLGDGPVEFTWRLGRQGAATHAFAGVGTLARGSGRTSGPLTVTIPDSAMRAFLRGLAAAPRRQGAYKPRIEHTDDYPELTIRLHTRAGITEFFSASQGPARRPWRVTIDARNYVSDSAAPAEALKHLLPFLQRTELEHGLAESAPIFAP